MKPTTFQIASTFIFLLALLHTFLTPKLYDLSRSLARKKKMYPSKYRFYHFSYEVVTLLSEVEVVFGIWLIPLLFILVGTEGFAATTTFLNAQQYSYPLFIMVIVIVVSTKPIIIFAEKLLERISRIGGDSAASWWWTIITVGPILSIILKEAGAMTLCAILLSKKFYQYKPSKPFAYMTFVLCLVNIAVSGLMMSFAARALFILSDQYGWDTPYMFLTFGWKALLGILLSNLGTYLLFRKEFKKNFPKVLPTLEKDETDKDIPFGITLIHILFLASIVFLSKTTPLFVGVFILFLGFHRATAFYQRKLNLSPAILVGFFFASLLIHAKLQGWWIKPFLADLTHFQTYIASFFLSGFVDNAAVNFLALQLPEFDTLKQYLVVTGTMSASALTIVANVPNPIGFSILRPAFHNRISFAAVFFYGLFPSLIFLTIFWLFRFVGP